jgi:hypothetical protein
LIFPSFFHYLQFFDFIPLQKSAILFFSFSTVYLIFHLLHFSKFQKKLKRILEKTKGKVAFHFFAFGRWDKHLGDMCEWGTKVGSD